MGNHRSKTAKIRGFHLARNTLLGLNELTYSLTITYCYSTGLCWAYKSDRISCYKRHECVGLPKGPDWSAVQILDRLQFTGSDAGRTVSVSFSTLGTDSFATKNFNEWTTKPLCCRYGKNCLDYLSWQWASGCSLRAKFMNTNINAISNEYVNSFSPGRVLRARWNPLIFLSDCCP